jgi:hypothetical protein
MGESPILKSLMRDYPSISYAMLPEISDWRWHPLIKKFYCAAVVGINTSALKLKSKRKLPVLEAEK